LFSILRLLKLLLRILWGDFHVLVARINHRYRKNTRNNSHHCKTVHLRRNFKPESLQNMNHEPHMTRSQMTSGNRVDDSTRWGSLEAKRELPSAPGVSVVPRSDPLISPFSSSFGPLWTPARSAAKTSIAELEHFLFRPIYRCHCPTWPGNPVTPVSVYWVARPNPAMTAQCVNLIGKCSN
jgi:hypothetical protein